MDDSFEQSEQRDKLEDLEVKVRELSEIVQALEEEGMEEDEIDTIREIDLSEGKAILHWVKDSEYGTNAVADQAGAKTVFKAAAQTRDAKNTPVNHGDFMVIGGTSDGGNLGCPWIALCVAPDDVRQYVDPHAPETAESELINSQVSREFVVWNACFECAPCSSISTLGTSSSWAPSTSCVKLDKVTKISASSDSDGTTITVHDREFSINTCGELVAISAERIYNIEIPCCGTVWDDPCEADAYSYSNTYTVSWTDSAGVSESISITRVNDPDTWGCWYWSGGSFPYTVTMSLNANQLAPTVSVQWNSFDQNVAATSHQPNFGWTKGDNLTGSYRDNVSPSGPYDVTVA